MQRNDIQLQNRAVTNFEHTSIKDATCYPETAVAFQVLRSKYMIDSLELRLFNVLLTCLLISHFLSRFVDINHFSAQAHNRA